MGAAFWQPLLDTRPQQPAEAWLMPCRTPTVHLRAQACHMGGQTSAQPSMYSRWLANILRGLPSKQATCGLGRLSPQVHRSSAQHGCGQAQGCWSLGRLCPTGMPAAPKSECPAGAEWGLPPCASSGCGCCHAPGSPVGHRICIPAAYTCRSGELQSQQRPSAAPGAQAMPLHLSHAACSIPAHNAATQQVQRPLCLQGDSCAAVSSQPALAARDRRTSFGLVTMGSNLSAAVVAGLTSRALPSSSRPQLSLSAAASSLAYQTQLQAAASAQLPRSGAARPLAWRLQASQQGKAQPINLAQSRACRAGPLAACAALLQVLQQGVQGSHKLSSLYISCSGSALGSAGPGQMPSGRAAAAMQGAARTVVLEEDPLDLRVVQQASNGHPAALPAAQQLAGDSYGHSLGDGLVLHPR